MDTYTDVYLRYKGYKDLIEELFPKFSEEARNGFGEAETERLTGRKIKYDIAHPDVTLQNGMLLNGKGGFFELNNDRLKDCFFPLAFLYQNLFVF